MYQLVVLYHQPNDPQFFDKHYEEVHTPLASRMPGLQRFTVTRPGTGPDGSKPAYHLIAVLEFDDAEALQAGLGSDEGKTAVADLDNFAQPGVTILAGPTVTV